MIWRISERVNWIEIILDKIIPSPLAIAGEEDNKGLISDYTTTQVVRGLAYDAPTLNENWARVLGIEDLARKRSVQLTVQELMRF